VLTRIIKLIALLILFMATAGLGAYLTIHLLIRSESTVVVPDLQHKEIVYALERLAELGLNIKVKGTEFNSTVPRHHVIHQDPEPGAEIKSGRDVRVLLSKGARAVIYPNLTGLGLAQARLLLEENGLRPGRVSRMASDHLPLDAVLTQSPPAGANGLRDDQIDLLVSSGPVRIHMMMPDLRGSGLNQALDAVERRRLIPGLITYQDRRELPGDLIIDHSPAAGSAVTPAESVDLVVNRHGSAAAFSISTPGQLLRYRIPPGFLRRSIRVSLSMPFTTLDFHNNFIAPGEELWLLVPQDAAHPILMYVDDEQTAIPNYDR
jgi:eukaryotic-like serine/threonine-protein kinase